MSATLPTERIVVTGAQQRSPSEDDIQLRDLLEITAGEDPNARVAVKCGEQEFRIQRIHRASGLRHTIIIEVLP